MLEDLRNLATEPEIAINGTDLRPAQAMMIRVLLLTLVVDLERSASGARERAEAHRRITSSDRETIEHREQATGYQALAISILDLMRTP